MSCPVCRSADWREIAPADPTFRLDECRSCGCQRISDASGRYDASAAYGAEYYRDADARRLYGPWDALWRWLRGRRARQLIAASAPGQRICDIGCERGDLLGTLKAGGRSVTGTQVSPPAATYARARGIDVFLGDIDDAPLVPGTFDHVTLFNVVEHLEDPDRYVRRAASLLRPGGRIWVEAPNIASITARMTGKRWLHHDPAHHLWGFSEASLRSLLERHGFAVERSEHMSPEYGPIGCLQSWLNALPGPRNVLFDLVRRGPDRRAGRVALQAVHALLATALLPAALLVSLAEAALHSGQVVLVVARRT